MSIVNEVAKRFSLGQNALLVAPQIGWRKILFSLSLPAFALALTLLLRQHVPSLTLFLFVAAVSICTYQGGLVGAAISGAWSVILVESVLIKPDFMASQMPLWYAMFFGITLIIAWSQEKVRETNLQLIRTTQQLEAILNAVSDGITVQDSGGVYIYANAAAAQVTGLSPQKLKEIVPDEIRSSYHMYDENGQLLDIDDMPFQKVFKHGAWAEITLRSESPYFEGERWFHIVAAPILDEKRTVQCAVNVFRNVTERHTAEAEQKTLQAKIVQQAQVINQQHDRLEALLNTVPVMVWEGEGDPAQGQTMVYINNYGEKLLGYTLDEWNQSPDKGLEWIHPDDLELAKQKSAVNFTAAEPQSFEFRFIGKAGQVVTVEARTAITRDADGNPIGARGIMTDVTARRRAEEELKRSNEELQQFASVASHDLQEPLRMITNYLQLIDQRYTPQLDADAREFIAFALDGATRMQALIHDLLTHSRVQANPEQFQPVDMNQIAQHVLQHLASKIEECQAVVTVEPLPTVCGNANMLTQLLQNLVGNALKFRADAPPKVHVSVQRQHNEWIFSVADNGIGIDPKNAERIFVIFQRLHSRSKYSGTGIGLAICKKVVERHDGRIWVKSEIGAGATFYFALPARMG